MDFSLGDPLRRMSIDGAYHCFQNPSCNQTEGYSHNFLYPVCGSEIGDPANQNKEILTRKRTNGYSLKEQALDEAIPVSLSRLPLY